MPLKFSPIAMMYGLLTTAIYGNPASTIAVTVVDEQDLPVPAAAVTLHGRHGTYSEKTSLQGLAEFEVPSGAFFITARAHSSFESRSGKLFLSSSGNVSVKFKLLFVDSTGSPALSLKHERFPIPGTPAVLVIRYVNKESKGDIARYTGEGLEVGIGRFILHGKGLTCARHRVQCTIEGPIVMDHGDKARTVWKVVIEPAADRRGRVIAMAGADRYVMPLEAMMAVPKLASGGAIQPGDDDPHGP
jgi:hypothetical protein